MTHDLPEEVDLSKTLVERFRSGDDDAGQELERLHRPSLLRFSLRYLRNADEAEDAVQEVFARILSAQQQPQNFRAWSYRIARNVCLNQLRSLGNRRDRDRMETNFDVSAQETGALTRLIGSENDAELGALLSRLSEAQREVPTLRYLEGLDREEIADVLEESVQVVKSRLFEGVSRLRALSSGN